MAAPHFRDIWNALDVTEEHHSIKQAKQVRALRRAMKEKIPKEERRQRKERKKRRMEGDAGRSSGLELPTPLTQDTIEAMVVSFARGDKLSYNSARHIIETVRLHLRTAPNVARLSVPEGGKLTVCGDLHGQLPDLLTVWKLNGLPSAKNIYLFNGDVVDRGANGCECLFALLAFKALYPSYLHINRGNHEAKSMNCKYHFQEECFTKYDRALYSLIQDLFNHLPLCTVIGNRYIVLHGGLFVDEGVKLHEINAIDRFRQPPDSSDERLDRIFTDILWSDPRNITGTETSDRGAGVHFGADITQKFLQDNSLELVIRSHEVMDGGFEYTHNKQLLTVFSASDYCGVCENQGAFVCIDHALHITCQQYKASDVENMPGAKFDPRRVQEETLMKLRERIFECSEPLMEAFTKRDTNKDGFITLEAWQEELSNVTKLAIDWIALAHAGFLGGPYRKTVDYNGFIARFRISVPDQVFERYSGLIEQICTRLYDSLSTARDSFRRLSTDGSEDKIKAEDLVLKIEDMHLGLSDHAVRTIVASIDTNNDGYIDVEEYLARFNVVYRRIGQQKAENASWLVEAMSKFKDVVKIRNLEKVFRSLDKENSGSLTYKQFYKGIKHLGVDLSKDESMRLAELLDTDKNDRVDYEELVHAFRLVDPKSTAWRATVINELCTALYLYKHHLKDLFHGTDKDGSGTLSFDEFHDLLGMLRKESQGPKLTEEQIGELFRAFDKDGSGDLAYEEFSKIIDTFEVVDMAEDEDIEVEVLDDDEPSAEQKGKKGSDVKMKDAKEKHEKQHNNHPPAAAPHPQAKEEKCEKK